MRDEISLSYQFTSKVAEKNEIEKLSISLKVLTKILDLSLTDTV